MIAAALAEQGAEIPADLQPVEAWPVAAPYRVAFRVLSAARSQAGSMQGSIPQPIEYSAMVLYAEQHGQADTVAELDEFVTFMQAQDSAYLENTARALAARTS